MKINYLGLYPLALGIICLFFPYLIVFGYGAEGFDWLVVSFLTAICIFLISWGISILFGGTNQ